MKKKLLSLLLCTSMLATLAAGCGSKAKEADKPKGRRAYYTYYVAASSR